MEKNWKKGAKNAQKPLSEFPTFLYENTWKPKTICTCWIQKILNFLFLKDVHDKKSFPEP
jgi:hypothetical protein